MRKKECIAMLLAGGEGRRLKSLTRKLAKPAVRFGGKYRIIDFPLSNCTNSGIDTVGVLTQYEPLVLNRYIGIGSSWDLDRQNGGVTVLPPFAIQEGAHWYTGTANAIYHNFGFIEHYHPDHVLILSGDHIYKMNYGHMLQFHKDKGADVTIATITVPWEEASRFGIIVTDEEERITHFQEKPARPDSNLASMGVYIFKWSVLKKYLLADAENPSSSHDFGKDVLPLMLAEQSSMYAYPFAGYWRDVGTIESLWEANMDLLADEPELDLFDPKWRIYSREANHPPHYMTGAASVKSSMISGGCIIKGEVDHSMLFNGVYVGEGSVIKDAVIMPNVKIGKDVVIERAIVGPESIIEDGARIGSSDTNRRIVLVEDRSVIGGGAHVYE